MITFLCTGIVFGLSAGFSPGPLLVLVISQTLQHGTREGIKVALAPLVTDLPIILASTLVLARLSGFRPILGGISLIGGIFVAYLAWGSLRTGSHNVAALPEGAPQSLGKGVLVNLLSPHPYLFWLTVGAPFVVRAWGQSPGGAPAFIAGFYLCLIGAKVAVAAATARSRKFLSGRTYGWLMRALGVLLLVVAVILLRDGANLIKS